MSERNVDALEALFHEKAVFVHMGGSMTRAQELGVIKGGGIVMISMLASAIAHAFQSKGPEQAAASQKSKTDASKPVVVKRGAEKPAATTAPGDDPKPGVRTLTGKDALGDWTTDAPGVRRKITVDDLATPYDTPSANNFPRVVRRPEGAWPKAPEGFEVTEFATG